MRVQAKDQSSSQTNNQTYRASRRLPTAVARVQAHFTFRIQIKTPLPKRPLLPQVPHRGRPQRPLATSLDCAAALRGRLPAPSHLPQSERPRNAGEAGPALGKAPSNRCWPRTRRGLPERHKPESRDATAELAQSATGAFAAQNGGGVRGGGGASRTSSVLSPGRAGPPSAAPADRKGAPSDPGRGRLPRSGGPRPEKHRRVEGRSARLPLQTPSPPHPPFRLVAPSSTTKRESCPSAHLNQLRSLDAVLRTERSPGRSRPARP